MSVLLLSGQRLAVASLREITHRGAEVRIPEAARVRVAAAQQQLIRARAAGSV